MLTLSLVTILVTSLFTPTRSKILYAGVNEVWHVSFQIHLLIFCAFSRGESLVFFLRTIPDLAYLDASTLITRSSTRFILTKLAWDWWQTTTTQSTVDIFVDQEKINFFRVTFLMERMCPLALGLGGQFNETVKFQSIWYTIWAN